MSAGGALGAYREGTGPLHSLGASAKLLWLASMTVCAFASGSAFVAWVLLAGAVAAALWAGVGLRGVLGALRPAAVVLALALACNALVADGTGDLTLLGPLGVSWGGLARGAAAVARVAALVAWALVYSVTTTAQQTVDALSRLLAPLERAGVPVASWAMVASLVLRFVPLCAEEVGRVRDAQRARGVDLGSGAPWRRVARWRLVLAPLVVALFRRADECATAMADRCWGMPGRTVAPARRTAADVLVAAAAVCFAVLCCLGRR